MSFSPDLGSEKLVFLMFSVVLLVFSGQAFNSFCDSTGVDGECIVNESRTLEASTFEFSSLFLAESSAVFQTSDGMSSINIFNTTFLSGTWRGSFNISSNDTTVKSGASFEPEGGRILIGTPTPPGGVSFVSGCSGVSGSSGVYTVDLDGDGGVDPFDVYCEMDENGGGWIKLRIDDDGYDANSDNMLWFSKYDTVSDQRSTHGSIGEQFDWNQLKQLSSEDDLDPEFSPNYEEMTNRGSGPEPQTNKYIQYEMAGPEDIDYTQAQLNAIREHVNKISSTTRMFSHTNDDDNCNPNGEIYLRLENGGTKFHITPYTSGNQVSYSRYWDETDFANNEYILPSYIDYGDYDTSGCSGTIDHMSWGYEQDYVLVKNN